MEKSYLDTVRLLLKVAPEVFAQPDFAMKGGTGLNLFTDQMPRLSVDIDVVYTDHQKSRQEALQAISTSLEIIKDRLSRQGLEIEIVSTHTGEDIRLLVRQGSVLVKVDVNHVFRGTLLPVESRRLGEEARALFATEISAPILATSELYGSKLVAAMDRQHPRDFFDVRGMYANSGLTPEIVECFVSYLAGHNRPVHEVLFSNENDMGSAFTNEFIGMTRVPVTLDELLAARRKLRQELPLTLTDNHRKFLLSLVAAVPDWSLMKCPHLSELPAIRWKVQNISALKTKNRAKFNLQTTALEEKLSALG